ncbi:unnamed protein product [Lampetra fluviatilis]
MGMALLLVAALAIVAISSSSSSPSSGSSPASSSCPPSCRCDVQTFGLFDSFRLTRVDCSGLSAPPAPPAALPLDATWLDLSRSGLRSLAAPGPILGGPGYTTLASLDLSGNRLAEVRAGDLSRLRYLDALNLSGNALEELAPGALAGPPLSAADVSRNSLRFLRLGAFGRGGPALSVDASRNLVHEVVGAEEVEGVEGVEGLNLRALDLSRNELRAVPSRALRGLPLRRLGLARNPIAAVPAAAFAGMAELTHLWLDHMRGGGGDGGGGGGGGGGGPALLVLSPLAFQGLGHLQLLDLSGNRFPGATSWADTLAPLSSLHELRLSGALAATPALPGPLPAGLTRLLPELRRVSLAGSAYACAPRRVARITGGVGGGGGGFYYLRGDATKQRGVHLARCTV